MNLNDKKYTPTVGIEVTPFPDTFEGAVPSTFKHYDPDRHRQVGTLINVGRMEEVAEKLYQSGLRWIHTFKKYGIELGNTVCKECGECSGIGDVNMSFPCKDKCFALVPMLVDLSDSVGDPYIKKESFDIIVIGLYISHYTFDQNCSCALPCAAYVNKESLPPLYSLLKIAKGVVNFTDKCSCGLIKEIWTDKKHHKAPCIRSGEYTYK